MCGWIIAALFLTVVANLAVQAQQGSSLADIARQARAQKQTQGQTTDSNRAQQVADELSEDQNDNGAPGGFKTFNAGDYKLFVPAPYKVEGHDDAGVVLSGPNVGMKHSIVLVGTPVVAHFGNNDDAFHDMATQFVHLYAQSANCTKTTIANHSAYQCSMAAANLNGQVVGGNAVFVMGSGLVYPVFCVAPTDSGSRDYINSKRANATAKEWAQEALNKEDENVKKVLQNCDTVFQSIHVREGAAPQKEIAGSSKETGIAAKPGVEAAVDSASAPVQPAAGSTIPAGFKLQAFSYCKNINECWDASVFVPAAAQLVSTDCKQFVFELKVQGAPFLLLMGPAGTDRCDGHSDPASQVRWKQLVDPETARAPGTSSTISALQARLDGKSAVITQMRFKKGLADWIGKRAEVENNGAQLVVGCMAPKETFADGDTICSGLIESLRLP
jgi:hypothetical protein